MEVRTLPIRRIGNRTNLFLGADRELVMLAGLLATVLIVVALDWLAFLVGVALWFSALFALRKMAKSDPNMREIYLRHRRYNNYYPARATPFISNRRRYS